MDTKHTRKRAPAKKVASVARVSAVRKSKVIEARGDLLLGEAAASYTYNIFREALAARIVMIKRGIAAGNVPLLAKRMDTPRERLVQWLDFPSTTIARKIRLKQDLTQDQAERFVGLSALVGQVEAMVAESGNSQGFDAAHWVARWLEQPNPALGNRRPAEYMDTVAGQELVSALIARAQSGAYA